MIKLLTILITLILSNGVAADDNIKCAAFVIEQNDANIEFLKIKTKIELYLSMAVAVNIQTSILTLDAIIEYQTGGNYLALINSIDRNLADIDGLKNQYVDAMEQEKVLLQHDADLIAKYADTSCESYIMNIPDLTKACKLYGSDLKETITCKSIKHIASITEGSS